MKFMEEKIPEIRVIKPEATYLVWLDLKNLNLSDKSLRKLIIEDAGLGLNDGPTFGKGGAGFQRINIALSKKQLEIALLKLENAILNIR